MFCVQGASPRKLLGVSDLKYLESFENPYVKITLQCKVCGKEQSLKHQHTWKRHFLTHASDEEKPFKCTLCPKSFIRSSQLRNHEARQHSIMQPVKKCENNEYRQQSTIPLVNKRDGDDEGNCLNPDIFTNRMQQVKTEFLGY